MNSRDRKSIPIPKELANTTLRGAVTISHGECEFCNSAADVVAVPGRENDFTPIVLHAGKACEQSVRKFGAPQSTGLMDETGIHRLA